MSVSSIETFTADIVHDSGLSTASAVPVSVVTLSDGTQYMFITDSGASYDDISSIELTGSTGPVVSVDETSLADTGLGLIEPNGEVDGTDGADNLNPGFSDVQGDEINGADGLDDVINARAGDDTVVAGFGDDTVNAGDGNDLIFGNEGEDSLLGNDGNDSLFGDNDDDTLEGNDGNDKLIGGAGDDILFGDAGDDTLYGDNFAGDLGGQSPTDTPEAGFGSDTLVLNGGNDQAFGGSGDDEFRVFDGFGSHEITGGETGETEGDRIDASAFTEDTTTILESAEAGTISDGSSTMSFREIEQIDLGDGDDRVEVVSSSTGRVNGDDGFDTLVLPDPAPGAAGPVVTVTSETSFPGVPGATTKTGFVTFPDGSRMDFENFEEILCFTPGALIDTAKGQVKVEDLRPGDHVLTRDHGYQPLAWVGRRDLSAEDLAACAAAAPVRIEAGALGANLPDRDLIVSPRHRMLITGARAELMFGEREVLVTAADLMHLPGVTQLAPEATSYIHVMCEAHQIIRAEGSWTESFQPGEAVLNTLDAQTRAELLDLFPELATQAGQAQFHAARPVLNETEARTLFAA